MNLIIDAGNSLIKLAIFQKDREMYYATTNLDGFSDNIKELFKYHPKINNAIICNVGSLSNAHVAMVKLYCKVHVLSPSSKVPFKNSYATPQTLGMDRIALVAAAFYGNPHQNTLVIDAGTCITYDFINDDDTYLGGAIAPGIQMRYKAMHGQTANLPLLEKQQVSDFIGNSTESCMHSGVVNGVFNEIEGVIGQYKLRFKDLTVILTGGDAQFLSKRLKNTIFADSKFLLKGLNYLLEYNKH